MANLLPDGDFELELWTLGGVPTSAEYTQENPLTGLNALLLEYTANEEPAATSLDFSVTAGQAATLQFWVRANSNSDNRARLRLWHYPSGVLGGAAIVWSAIGTDFDVAGKYQRFTVDFTPAGADDRIVWNGVLALGFGGNTFRVDDMRYLQGADSVAVKLAERGIDAVVSCLQTYLPTELTAIDTERADTITMAAPANVNYYKRPKPEMAGATAHVEVYEEEFGFGNFYSDSGDSRAVFDLPVTVRLTYFNRTGGDRNEMVTRMRRYSAGIFNVIAKHTDLADSDAATNVTELTLVTPPWSEISEEEPNTFKGQITIQLTVKCEEVQ